MIAALMAALDLAKATLMLLQMSLLLANPQPAIAQNNSVPFSAPILALNLSQAETSTRPAMLIPPNNPKQSIIDIIEEEASNLGVNPSLAVKIAECESQFDPLARSSISTAKGIFQFINGTWIMTMIRMGLPTSSDVFNIDLHIKAATWLLNEDGTGHWNASKNCWNK